MANIISDLHRLSRISLQNINQEAIDLTALANDIVETLSSTREAAPDVKVHENLRAYGDRGLIRVFLENLFSNAYKYAGGHDGAQIEFGSRNDAQQGGFSYAITASVSTCGMQPSCLNLSNDCTAKPNLPAPVLDWRSSIVSRGNTAGKYGPSRKSVPAPYSISPFRMMPGTRRRTSSEISDQAFGNVTPRCPWYFPLRSRYDTSQVSSDSKKIICATPSLA